MAQKRDYYDVLGVSPGVDAGELKRAFRKAAMDHHPDRNPSPDAEERFKEIAEAYEVLSDPARRQRYDQFGHSGMDGVNIPNVGDIFSELFGDLFGGGRRGTTVMKGADLRYDLELTFEQAVFGAEVPITLQRPVRCEECEGTGSKSKKRQPCQACSGTGELRFSQGFFAVARTCSRCSGTGQIISDPCRSCRGEGLKNSTVEIKVKIPAGVGTGTKVRVSGGGEPGPNNGIPGDLYVIIHSKEHPLFHREDTELLCEAHISFTQAALGAAIEVPTLEGKDILDIPAGTQSGRVFKLSGKGVPFIRGRGRGDLHVRIVVETPQNLTASQKELLLRLEAESGQTMYPRTKGFLEKVKELFR